MDTQEKSKILQVKTAFQKNITILKLIHQISPKYLPVLAVTCILKSAYPFINIICSYLILDGLITRLSTETIMNYVYWMVGLNLVFSVISQFLDKWVVVQQESTIPFSRSALIGLHSLNMDYEQLEKLEVREMLRSASDGENAWGGIRAYCTNLGRILQFTLSAIYAIVLLVPLLFTQAQTDSSMLGKILASPLSNLILLGIFLFPLFLNSNILSKANKFSENLTMKIIEGNRSFFYFMNLINNYQIGKDIRCYRIDIPIMHMWDDVQKEQNILFTYAGKKKGHFSGIPAAINQISIFLFYSFIGAKALIGVISIGSVLKFVSSLSQLSTAITKIITTFSDIAIQAQYIDYYIKFLSIENVKYQGQLPIEKRNDNQYEIEFKDVSFHYPDNDEMILEHVSFKLKIGDKYAIVGPNGAGKTTFIKLLCRLYDPTEGQILLNGIDIKKYDYKEYLQLFSVVFQDFKLFSFDIAQNVATDTNYDEKKVWDCLDKAGVGERVRQMDKKLQSKLYQSDDDGIEISGGEAQKIAIARALYKDAPFVILDEPTSALDPISEYEIYSKFDTLVTDKTSIYISHRMSSCRFCDNIVVFEKGKIVQLGNHESLLQDEAGLYYQLWSSQAKYYAEAEVVHA